MPILLSFITKEIKWKCYEWWKLTNIWHMIACILFKGDIGIWLIVLSYYNLHSVLWFANPFWPFIFIIVKPEKCCFISYSKCTSYLLYALDIFFSTQTLLFITNHPSFDPLVKKEKRFASKSWVVFNPHSFSDQK